MYFYVKKAIMRLTQAVALLAMFLGITGLLMKLHQFCADGIMYGQWRRHGVDLDNVSHFGIAQEVC